MRRIEWEKIKLDDGAYESAAVFDVNNNGRQDIVCGGYWYEAPDWKKHKLRDIMAVDEYYDDFTAIVMDVNGNGFLDIISGGWFGNTLVWVENPQGRPVEWTVHEIENIGNIETGRAWDIDGDGHLEVVPNTPGGPQIFFKLIRDENGKGTGEFQKYQIQKEGGSGHGLGFGEVAPGKKGLVVTNGWWEVPQNPLEDEWIFHQEFDLGSASVPIIVADVDGDGLSELIYGHAHGYGLNYLKQRTGPNGERTWTKHPIDPWFSQYHDMHWVDITGDGECELVTGNRYRAHCGRDPGETDIVGLYYFKWNGESFTKCVIDHGKASDSSGTGIHFAVADLDGNGRLGIVAPGKEGLYIFKNLGPEMVGVE